MAASAGVFSSLCGGWEAGRRQTNCQGLVEDPLGETHRAFISPPEALLSAPPQSEFGGVAKARRSISDALATPDLRQRAAEIGPQTPC